MIGLVAYGVYVPFWRLRRDAINGVLGGRAVRGSRTVASYDEDTTSMGLEAGRIALRTAPENYSPSSLWFSTTEPAYLDKTNGVAIHAALGLKGDIPVFDAVGSVRSGIGAMWAARASGGMVVLADIRVGLPGSADESCGGDCAVSLAFGTGDDVIARPIAESTSTGEFLERWRVPGCHYSKQWEDRYGEFAFGPHVDAAVSSVLKKSGIDATTLDHVIVSGMHSRAVAAATKSIGTRRVAFARDLSDIIGNPGVAQWGLLFSDVLDRAEPEQTIAIITLADGCHAEIWRTTPALAKRERSMPLGERVSITGQELNYAQYLTWRGLLDREPPRRPEPDRPAAPPSGRSASWKFGFTGSRDETGFVHTPPSRVSTVSGSIDEMTPISMREMVGTIVTFTIDHLSYSLSPPLVAAVIDFDGGGRIQCELTDVDRDSLKVGDRVEMTFRRLYTQDGVHNYFWKARPVTSAVVESSGRG